MKRMEQMHNVLIIVGENYVVGVAQDLVYHWEVEAVSRALSGM